MSAFAQNLAGAQGCSVDGTATAANPLGQVVNSLLGSVGTPQHHNGRMVGGQVRHPRGDIRAGMQAGFRRVQGQARPPPPQIMGDVWAGAARGPRPVMGVAAPAPQFQAQHRQMGEGWAGEAARMRQSSTPAGAAWAMEARAQQPTQIRQSSAAPSSHYMGPPRGVAAMPGMRGPMMAPMHMGGGMPGMMGPVGLMPHPASAQMYQPPPPQMQSQMPANPAPALSRVKQAPSSVAPSTPAVAEAKQAIPAREEVDENGKGDMSETRSMTAEMVRVLSKDGRFKDSEFLGFMDRISKGEVEFDGNSVVPGTEATKLDAAREAAARKVDGNNLMRDETAGVALESEDASELEERLAQAWKDSMAGKEVDLDAIWGDAVRNQEGAFAGLENLGNMFGGDVFGAGMNNASKYELPKENKFRGQSDLFDRGMQLFSEGAIDDAIAAFQAFLEVEEDDPSEGWRMLGVAHQEHDQDRKAIMCLEKAVEEDPYNLDALLALGVSYVNELDKPRSLATLKKWVKHNPNFQGMNVQMDAYSDGSLEDEVMQLMISAQQAASANGGDDADVQIVLGVLYNVSRDYDSAVDAFQKAVAKRPHDYSLWNKLGATLANGSRSNQALPAYHRALEIKPKYARGRLNLGISHANMQNYEAAARCYLQALRLNPGATHIWSYLRVAFTCMKRPDLVEKVSFLLSYRVMLVPIYFSTDANLSI